MVRIAAETKLLIWNSLVWDWQDALVNNQALSLSDVLKSFCRDTARGVKSGRIVVSTSTSGGGGGNSTSVAFPNPRDAQISPDSWPGLATELWSAFNNVKVGLSEQTGSTPTDQQVADEVAANYPGIAFAVTQQRADFSHYQDERTWPWV